MSSGDCNWVPPSLSKFLAKPAENKFFLGGKLFLTQEGVISTSLHQLYWLFFLYPDGLTLNSPGEISKKISRLPEWFEIAIYIHSTMICENCLCVFFTKIFSVNELNVWQKNPLFEDVLVLILFYNSQGQSCLKKPQPLSVQWSPT